MSIAWVGMLYPCCLLYGAYWKSKSGLEFTSSVSCRELNGFCRKKLKEGVPVMFGML